jgi:signal transduction histidine kinase
MCLPASKTPTSEPAPLKSLYLRIWLTVVAALALFALASGWMWQRHLDQERSRFERAASERVTAWAELVQRALPSADAPTDEQAEALRDWSTRLRVPLALDDRRGVRIGASVSFLLRQAEGGPPAAAVRLDDGRTLWLARRMMRRPGAGGPPHDDVMGHDAMGRDMMARDGSERVDRDPPALRAPRGPLLGDQAPGPALGDRVRAVSTGAMLPFPPPMSAMPFGLPQAVAPLILVALLFVAVAAGAYPVVRRLTRRLEQLKQGVEAFGAGDLAQRVDASGRDEVAAVAATFNQAAGRIESLVRSHQTLLANASHELRSPLARLKMAVALYADAPVGPSDGRLGRLRHEIDTNVAELDALVEEVLLASRLDAGPALGAGTPVDLLGLAAEEAARVDAEVEAPGEPADWRVAGSDRLLRRAMRNLLENARRYGGGEISVQMALPSAGQLQLRVCDRGAGVPSNLRERIFEPYFRLPGHAEREGGVGLGLSLVRQIAQRHGGSVHCEARQGGGSCFVLRLPVLVPAGEPIDALPAKGAIKPPVA